MSKHTPAPWKAHFDETYYVTGPDLGSVSTITHLKGKYGMGGRRTAEESAANARLIAAAPDLLGALEYMLAVCPAIDEIGEEARLEARAAIAKARGES